MEDQLLYEMKGGGGVYLLNTTDTSVISGKGIVIREDTVIGIWTDDDDKDMLGVFNIVGASLMVTDPVLWMPGTKKMKTIKLTSGSVWVIK